MVERMDEVVGRVGDHRLEPKQLVAIEMEDEDMRVDPRSGTWRMRRMDLSPWRAVLRAWICV